MKPLKSWYKKIEDVELKYPKNTGKKLSIICAIDKERVVAI
jgi:hypothetical protein